MRFNIVLPQYFGICLILFGILVGALPTGFNGSSPVVGHQSSKLEWQKGTSVPGSSNSARSVPTSPLSPRSAQQCVWSAIGNEWRCDFQMPRISEFVARMRNVADGGGASPDAHVWFWTNLQGSGNNFQDTVLEWPISWLQQHGYRYYNIFDAQNSQWYRQQTEWVYTYGRQMEEEYFPDGEAARAELFHCQYQASATAALNPDAILFTPADQEWDPDSVWAGTEFPALTKNLHISRIWRVDPRPGKCGTPQLLWVRGRDAEVPFGVDEDCDFTDVTSV